MRTKDEINAMYDAEAARKQALVKSGKMKPEQMKARLNDIEARRKEALDRFDRKNGTEEPKKRSRKS